VDGWWTEKGWGPILVYRQDFGSFFFVELLDVGTYNDGAFLFCIALFACFGNYSSEIAGTV
jgi:hypothetical protein